jgi:hypothetical protein
LKKLREFKINNEVKDSHLDVLYQSKVAGLAAKIFDGFDDANQVENAPAASVALG